MCPGVWMLTSDRQGVCIMSPAQDAMRWRVAVRSVQDRGDVYVCPSVGWSQHIAVLMPPSMLLR